VLDGFIVGPENYLVEVAVHSILNDPHAGYSPVVFYGPSGTGKSHLALGLAAAWKTYFPKRCAAYVPAIDFARDLADAVQTKTLDDFGLRYRQLSLLVLDGLEHLIGKSAAQRELTFTLDALHARDGRLVITANRFPGELRGLLTGLQSRLAQGLAVPLAAPGRQARLAILRRLADGRSVRFSDGALRMLADQLSKTVPELLGVLTQLEFSVGTSRRAVNSDSVQEYLVQCNGSHEPSLRGIASTTACFFSLRVKDLRGPSRRRPAPTARALAMYLARNLTTQSLRQIGSYFGGRDHTTVSYSYRKTEERLRTEPEIRDALFAIQKELQRS
jgi:chromosomal replication initiator protein